MVLYWIPDQQPWKRFLLPGSRKSINVKSTVSSFALLVSGTPSGGEESIDICFLQDINGHSEQPWLHALWEKSCTPQPQELHRKMNQLHSFLFRWINNAISALHSQWKIMARRENFSHSNRIGCIDKLLSEQNCWRYRSLIKRWKHAREPPIRNKLHSLLCGKKSPYDLHAGGCKYLFPPSGGTCIQWIYPELNNFHNVPVHAHMFVVMSIL